MTYIRYINLKENQLTLNSAGGENIANWLLRFPSLRFYDFRGSNLSFQNVYLARFSFFNWNCIIDSN